MFGLGSLDGSFALQTLLLALICSSLATQCFAQEPQVPLHHGTNVKKLKWEDCAESGNLTFQCELAKIRRGWSF